MTVWIGFAQAPIVTGRYVSSQTCNQFIVSETSVTVCRSCAAVLAEENVVPADAAKIAT